LSQDTVAVDTAVATFEVELMYWCSKIHGLIAALEESVMLIFTNFFETNFFGALRQCERCLPVMRQQRQRIHCGLSSTAGLVGFGGSSLYCGAKFALEGTSEA